jgi:hypothetical protein
MRESASFTAFRDATRDLYAPVIGGGQAGRTGASDLLLAVPAMPLEHPVLQPGLMSTTADFVNDEPPLVTIIVIDPNPPPASEPSTLWLLLGGGLPGIGLLRRVGRQT